MTTTFYNAEKDIAVASGFADVVSNFSTDLVPGALEIRYKEKPIGWIGLPVLEMFPALKTWLEKSQDKTSDDEWNSIVQRYAEPTLEQVHGIQTTCVHPSRCCTDDRQSRAQ